MAKFRRSQMKPSTFHKVEIRTIPRAWGGARSAYGVEISLDGIPIKGLTDAKLIMGVDDVIRLQLELLPEDIICQLEEAAINTSRKKLEFQDGPISSCRTLDPTIGHSIAVVAENEHVRPLFSQQGRDSSISRSVDGIISTAAAIIDHNVEKLKREKGE
jgi:hypothetical protein